MGIGYIKVQTRTADDALPVRNAHILILQPNGSVLYDIYTDANGSTEALPLTAPDKALTLDPYYGQPAYSLCDVTASAPGFVTTHVHGVHIVDGETSDLPVKMLPILDEPSPDTERSIFLPPIALLMPGERNPDGPPADEIAQNADYLDRLQDDLAIPVQTGAPSPAPSGGASDIVIPEYITVHLGIPTNAAARNVRVRFTDYVKNVTSSEIYPTWPQSSLLANIAAITTFALNRVFTEWYRSRGFNFDITSSTSYDQAYRDGGEVYENISRLVDEYFNTFVRRIGFRNPFFTQFCNGTTATCPGLSQWGTVTLANQGMTPLQILRYYYPNDVELATSTNITGITESYPGAPLTVGSSGPSVARMQNFLNRIRVNYPLIPVISNPNGVFGEDTRNAVLVFQRTFNLGADGVIGRATWNKISFIFVGVTRLGELDGEGERVGLSPTPPTSTISQGSRGHDVLELQFLLNAIAPYYNSIPTVIQDSVFGPSVKSAVIEFQKTFGLTPDGIVGPATWRKLYAAFQGIEDNVDVPPAPEPEPAPPSPETPTTPQFPGTPLRVGSTGADVRLMQTYLNTIRIVYPSIPYLVVDGIFGPETRRAVVAFQHQFVLAPDGIIGPITWDYIVKQYQLLTGASSVSLEYPGVPLRRGSAGSSVRLMQGFLQEIRKMSSQIPAIAVDGIFGPQTEAAVKAFQRIYGLREDGIIGPITWQAIIRQRNAVV